MYDHYFEVSDTLSVPQIYDRYIREEDFTLEGFALLMEHLDGALDQPVDGGLFSDLRFDYHQYTVEEYVRDYFKDEDYKEIVREYLSGIDSLTGLMRIVFPGETPSHDNSPGMLFADSLEWLNEVVHQEYLAWDVEDGEFVFSEDDISDFDLWFHESEIVKNLDFKNFYYKKINDNNLLKLYIDENEELFDEDIFTTNLNKNIIITYANR